MADQNEDTATTTIRISRAHNAKLGVLCKQFGMNRQEFAEASIMYFSRPGKDPREAGEAGIMERLAELEKILKRFQSDWHSSKNSWEKQYLKPGIQTDVQLYNMLEKLLNSGNSTEIISMQIMLTAYLLTPDPVKQLGERKRLINVFNSSLSMLPFDSAEIEKIKSLLTEMNNVQEKF